MKKFNGYNEINVDVIEKLPRGAYVLRILEAKEEITASGWDTLRVSFDIVEGEYKDFYKNQYINSTAKDKKWKGVKVVYLPKDNGTDEDERTKRTFKTFISKVEHSNPGYSWDWNETGLKGKLVGGLFAMEEKIIDGKKVSWVHLFWWDNVDNIRTGKFTMPDDKLLTADQIANAEYHNSVKSGEPIPTDFVDVAAGINVELPFD